MSPAVRLTILRLAGVYLLTSLAVAFPFVFGRLLWPDGLSAGAEHLFWPASGVGTAAVFLFGRLHAIPVFLATTITPALFTVIYPINALGNAVEALLAAEVLRRVTGPDALFDGPRPAIALVAASLLAPLCSSLPGVWTLIDRGLLPPSAYWSAVGVWTLANANGILLLLPALVSFSRRDAWRAPRPRATAIAWLLAGLATLPLGFAFLIRGSEMNFAFLAFPFVVFAAVRFTPRETAVALLLIMSAVYSAVASQAGVVPASAIARSIWFVQSFCWMVAATSLVLAALAAARRAEAEKAAREQTRALEAALGESRARLDALRYQINPHFLFNSLNSVRALLPEDAATSRAAVTELADYLRATLDRPPGDLAPLGEEAGMVEKYLALEKIRFGDDLRVAFRIDPRAAAAPVPVFLLQPLVENAILHGFETARGAFSLNVSAELADDGLLRIEVANTGRWRAPSGRRTGLGLDNIRHRLALLYGPAAALRHREDAGWVRVGIELPLSLHLPRPPT